VGFLFLQAEEVEPGVLVDLCLSWILSIGRRGTDAQVTPLRLELIRPGQHRELLETHFGCRVRFKARRNALVFKNSDLDRPFVTYNEEVLAAIGAQLDSTLLPLCPWRPHRKTLLFSISSVITGISDRDLENRVSLHHRRTLRGE
jgi:hypothetical protein